MMERLTGRNEHGGIISLIEGAHRDVAYMRTVCALAAYEEAEESGLLVRLPCKVGDTVSVLNMSGHIGRGVIVMFFRNHVSPWDWATVDCDDGQERNYELERFDKTVFLTREEAEAALAKREGAR